jgi:hypothetical protein
MSLDVLLESLWGLEEEQETESIDTIAKRNREMHGPYSTSLWDRAALLDRLESGLDPLAHVDTVAATVVKSLKDNTRVTLVKLMERCESEGNDISELRAAFAAYGGEQ